MYVLYNMFCDLGMCQPGRCYVCVSRDTLHNGILYTVMVEASYVSFNGGWLQIDLKHAKFSTSPRWFQDQSQDVQKAPKWKMFPNLCWAESTSSQMLSSSSGQGFTHNKPSI